MRTLWPSRRLARLSGVWHKLDPIGVILFATVLAVYILTLAPGVLPSDYGELQFKPHTLEVVHPPGYPLFLLLGNLWLRLVWFGSIAWRMNLLSAVFSAVAIWLVYKFLHRLLGTVLPALVGAGMLAFSPLFWDFALTANVRSLTSLLFVGALHTWLLAYDQELPLAWPAALCSLGVTHHRVLALTALVLATATLICHRRLMKSWRILASSSVATILPLGLYGILIWQGVDPLGVWNNFMLLKGGAVQQVQGAEVILCRFAQSVWPWLYHGLGLFWAIVGIGVLILLPIVRLKGITESQRVRLRVLSLVLLAILIAHVIMTSAFIILPDGPRYLQPAMAVVAMGVAAAIAWIQRVLSEKAGKVKYVLSLLILVPAISVKQLFPVMSSRYDDYFGTLAREALTTMEEDATIIASWSYAMPLYYCQKAEGWRPDVTILMPDEVTRDQVVSWIQAGQNVYFREDTYGLADSGTGYYWVDMNVGGLYRALPKPPEINHWLSVRGVSDLVTARLSEWPLQPDTFVVLRIEATAKAFDEHDVGASARLVADGGQTWELVSGSLQRLVHGVKDDGAVWIELPFVVPPAIPPGDYTLSIRVFCDGQDLVSAAVVGVPVVPPKLPISPTRLPVVDLAESRKSGYDGVRLISAWWPGRKYTVNSVIVLPLFWQVLNDADAPVFEVLFISDAGSLVAGAAPILDDATRGKLPHATLIETKLGLRMAEIPPGRYRVEVQAGEGARYSTWDIGTIKVEPRAHVYRMPSMDNKSGSILGGEIELLGWSLSAVTLSPGEGLDLVLYWRPTTQPTGDYKVFTHLMDDSGTLVTQDDALPLGGLVLTSEWQPREIIEDVYHLDVPVDIRDGEYQLEVGMYIPDTGMRVPAMDAAGNRWLNDTVVLRQISIEVNAGPSGP